MNDPLDGGENLFIPVDELQSLVNFRRMMYGDWLHEEEPSQAEHMAKVYHAECDTYDKQVCTGDRNGEPMPITPEEHRAINRHSSEIRRWLLRENPGVTEKQLHEAIAKLAR